MTTIDKKGGTDSFYIYLNRFKTEARFEKAKEFYHVDVVADAYKQGFTDGENSGKKEFIETMLTKSAEKFTAKANQVYILTNLTISYLASNGYNVNSFFINLFHVNPKVIIAVENDSLLNDDFIELAYTKVFEMKEVFSNLFGNTLDMGIVGNNELDIQALAEDGYDYSEDLVIHE